MGISLPYVFHSWFAPLNLCLLADVVDLAWHMAAGMLMQINSLPSKAAQLDIPRAIVEQCAVDVGGAAPSRQRCMPARAGSLRGAHAGSAKDHIEMRQIRVVRAK